MTEIHQAKVAAFVARVNEAIITRATHGEIEKAKRLLKLKEQWFNAVFRESINRAKKQLGILV